MHTVLLLLTLTALTNIFGISGTVTDKKSGEPLPAAPVVVSNSSRTQSWAVTSDDGKYSVKNIPEGTWNIRVSYVGYKDLDTTVVVRSDKVIDFRLTPDESVIKEVVITATEERGVTSTTKIRQEAIEHIQPSSFADLLELLPGGMAKDPALSGPQLVNLRSANSLSNSDYATSALGTRFMIDGRPVGNNANMQSTPTYSNLGTSYVNYGTDMREITTEDIESVDVVRGIASVEYGDLTSGLIRIQRKKGGDDLHARFKADMKSKLFYIGKGFEWGERPDRLTMNASLNYLDSKADPREPRQSWKRLTGSYRIGKTWTGEYFTKDFSASLDYTGSFDNQKSDTDLDNAYGGGPIETYRSNYNKMALGTSFNMKSINDDIFFRSLAAMFSLTYERDLIDRWKSVFLGKSTPVSTSLDEGEHDAVVIPARYEATMQVDGRPLYAFFNTVANFKAGINSMKVGAEWTMDKNYGEGTIFDTSRPFTTGVSVRPRPYSAIPATHQLSAFAEDDIRKDFGNWKAEAMIGARIEAMAGAGSGYSVNMKPYFDPRANLRIDFPSFQLGGYKFDYGVYGGAGWHTKFPTMDQLYPDPLYGDIIQMNYWPTEENLRRVNLYVYRIDPTNFSLSVARNMKYEIGVDASWNGFSFSIDYFREDMKSGFRYGTEYTSVHFKDYDESSIDKSTLTGPPDLGQVPYRMDTLLTAYSFTTNGSRTLKQGIEFTFYAKRIKAIGTKITANGAWFLTKYMNSVPEYYRPSVMIQGKAYPYIGLYDKNDGTLYESFNTNVMFDTQVPSLGLVFSTSFQCQWFTGHQSMEDSKYPVAYIDKELVQHEFTQADASDGVLSHMVRDYTASLYQYQKVPFYMNVNLKVSKKLYHDKVSVAMFVNKIFDVTPDYYRNDVIVRRNVLPYFGMELDFKL